MKLDFQGWEWRAKPEGKMGVEPSGSDCIGAFLFTKESEFSLVRLQETLAAVDAPMD